jgi:hypothetical protein
MSFKLPQRRQGQEQVSVELRLRIFALAEGAGQLMVIAI